MTAYRPRVIHLIPALLDERGHVLGGAERYAYELARHMARTTPTTLVAFGPSERRWQDGDLRIHVLGGDWSNRRGQHDPLSRRLGGLARSADVIHCHQRSFRAAKAAGLAARVFGATSVVTDHGGGLWGPGTWLPDRRLFDGHVFVSEFSRHLNPPPRDRLHETVWGGVDVDRFQPGATTAVTRSILFVGRLLPHKGIDVLLQALPDGVHLDIAGAPLDERYLKDLHVLAAGRSVSFHHGWSDAEIRAAYRRARCVVLPSVYRDCYGRDARAPELLGQTLLEGMASGRPAVCTAVGGMPEVVQDGVTGYVVEPGDVAGLRNALERLDADAGLADGLGQAARERVLERFRWEVVSARCLRVYERLQPERRSRRSRDATTIV